MSIAIDMADMALSTRDQVIEIGHQILYLVFQEPGHDGTIHIHMNTGEWDSIIAFLQCDNLAAKALK